MDPRVKPEGDNLGKTIRRMDVMIGFGSPFSFVMAGLVPAIHVRPMPERVSACICGCNGVNPKNDAAGGRTLAFAPLQRPGNRVGSSQSF
jgi:hypothetical protein